MTLVERIQTIGIRRLGKKKSGFRYVRSGGGTPAAADLARIQALSIPPAWRDVAIHPSPRGAVQAVG
jgi:DNA topoisomerase-1